MVRGERSADQGGRGRREHGRGIAHYPGSIEVLGPISAQPSSWPGKKHNPIARVLAPCGVGTREREYGQNQGRARATRRVAIEGEATRAELKGSRSD